MKLSRPQPITIAAFGLVAIIGAISAYYQLFSQFAYYDDEGYVLISLSEFLHGSTLYSDVYTQYGPFFYEFFGAFYKLTGTEVTNDSGRLMVVVLWTVVATGYGCVAHAITKSLALGLLAQVVAFGALAALSAEPMHPHGLTTLLVLIVLAVAWRAQEHGRAALVLGIALAALALVKINLGALVTVAVLLAAVLMLAPRDRWRWLRGAALAVTGLAIVFLAAKSANQQWAQKLVLMELAAVAAIAIRVWQVQRPGGSAPLLAVARPLAIGFTAAWLLILAIVLVLGSSPEALVRGILLDPTKQSDVLVIPFRLPAAAVAWAAFSVAAAYAVTVLRASTAIPTPRWLLASALARAGVAVAIVISLIDVAPLSIGPPSGRLAIGVLVAWVVAVAPRESHESPARAFARLVCVLVAVLGVMQAYPVAVSQLKIAAIPFALLAALAAADCLMVLRSWQALTNAHLPARTQVFGQSALVATAAVFAMLWPLQDARNAYRAGETLELPGATRLHLPPQQAQAYEELTAAVEACPAVITLPGLNSLYIWSQTRPPSGQNATSWMLQLDSARQQRTVDALLSQPGYCVVRNQPAVDLALGASRFAAVPPRPLYTLLTGPGFEQVASFNDGKAGQLVVYKAVQP